MGGPGRLRSLWSAAALLGLGLIHIPTPTTSDSVDSVRSMLLSASLPPALVEPLMGCGLSTRAKLNGATMAQLRTCGIKTGHARRLLVEAERPPPTVPDPPTAPRASADGTGGGGKVVEANDTTLVSVLNAHPAVFVDFYAPWCDHCMQLEPEFEAAARLAFSGPSPAVVFGARPPPHTLTPTSTHTHTHTPHPSPCPAPAFFFHLFDRHPLPALLSDMPGCSED